jgi:hypothetical protein
LTLGGHNLALGGHSVAPGGHSWDLGGHSFNPRRSQLDTRRSQLECGERWTRGRGVSEGICFLSFGSVSIVVVFMSASSGFVYKHLFFWNLRILVAEALC